MPSDRNSDEPLSPKRPSLAEQTLAFEPVKHLFESHVRRFRLAVVKGPQGGVSWESGTDRCSIGSHPSNDLVISDPTVSRFHCEVQVSESGARVRDLDSRNGTILDGVQVIEGFARSGSLIRMGATVVQFQLSAESNPIPLSERTTFGSLVGASVSMLRVFGLLERAASSDSTVLLEGETGTGKGQMAQSIHRHSARKKAPFQTIDCSSIPANLLESELFGHEKGAFSGATERREGIFESANGGTIFLDEIGEMPQDLQPKLLRVLEDRVIRRIGSNQERAVNVRVIAATNRDLRAEVNLGRFRSDLYFRIAVLKVSIPPLRQRPEDIPSLVDHILRSFGASETVMAPFRRPEFLGQLQRSAWPGNVRELRNYLERCLVFEDALPMSDAMDVGGGEHGNGLNESSPSSPSGVPAVDSNVPFVEARRRAMGEWERHYLEELLQQHGGKMSQAAAAAGINRVYLYKLLTRHGLKK
jgi:two-component system, NtrC family, response regulator GlrR